MEIGGWLLTDRIGRGCFGEVWRAEERGGGGPARAVKRIDVSYLSERERELCVTEVKVLHRLGGERCPYIIAFVDSFLESAELCIVTELAPLGTLHARIRAAADSGGDMPTADVWRAFAETLIGLHVVHCADVLHRDLKALNIFVASDQTCKIGDFGVSRILSNPQSVARTMVGTPYYISPEMCTGRSYGPKSDVWALGIVLHEMCTARFPFEAANTAVLVLRITQARLGTLAAIRRRHGAGMSAMVRRCLAKHTGVRPGTLELLRDPCVAAAAQRHRLQLPASVVAAQRREVCDLIRAHPVCGETQSGGVDAAAAAAAAEALQMSSGEAAAMLRGAAATGSRRQLPSRRVRRDNPPPKQPQRRARPPPPPPPARQQRPESATYRSQKARARDARLVAALPDCSSDDGDEDELAAAPRADLEASDGRLGERTQEVDAGEEGEGSDGSASGVRWAVCGSGGEEQTGEAASRRASSSTARYRTVWVPDAGPDDDGGWAVAGRCAGGERVSCGGGEDGPAEHSDGGGDYWSSGEDEAGLVHRLEQIDTELAVAAPALPCVEAAIRSGSDVGDDATAACAAYRRMLLEAERAGCREQLAALHHHNHQE